MARQLATLFVRRLEIPVVLRDVEHKARSNAGTRSKRQTRRLRLGLPMAPSMLLAMVEPRVSLHVLETLHEAYPERFPLSKTLVNYAESRDEIVAAEPAR